MLGDGAGALKLRSFLVYVSVMTRPGPGPELDNI